MKFVKTSLIAAALVSCPAAAQQGGEVRTPEGALLDTNVDIAYQPGDLSQAQLTASNADILTGGGMNVFRRFPREVTAQMVRFYTQALALRSLNPIQLTDTQQMILTGVGSMQIKLSAGQPGGRAYDLEGGITGGTGIRYFRLTFPDAEAVVRRFTEAGFTPPSFTPAAGGMQSAVVSDPGGFPIQIVIQPGAQDHSDDGVAVGIGVSDLAASRAFYREFVGLTEQEAVEDTALGVTKYPYVFNETTIYLHQAPAGAPSDNGSSGIQYVVSDAPLAAARGAHRQVTVQTPLNRLRGFDLTTVWLGDPDNVTNYFAQLGPGSRSAREQAPEQAPVQSGDADLTRLPEIADNYEPQLTPWGEPDFRGSWPIDHLNSRTPLERNPEQGNRIFLTDEEFAEQEARVSQLEARLDDEDSSDQLGQGHWTELGSPNRRTSFIVAPANGRLPPKTQEGERRSDLMRSSWRAGQTFDSYTDFDSWDRCITRGLPASMMPMMYNNGIRIFQAPGLVAVQLEMIHETRLIPTDGRAALPPQVDNLMGSSRATWEDGNTLVVTTDSFAPGPSATNIVTSGSPPANDTPVSTSARMVERFHMTGPDTIVYEMTWDDPVIFTAPWSVRLDWQRQDDYEMFEYACHEGNVQIRNYITASRAQREASD